MQWYVVDGCVNQWLVYTCIVYTCKCIHVYSSFLSFIVCSDLTIDMAVVVVVSSSRGAMGAYIVYSSIVYSIQYTIYSI